MKRLVLAIAVVLLPVVARAGNLDGVFVSDQAAMMGGAVTALASDTTATFYNPAGLAADTSHTSVSITTSSYGLSTRSSPSLVAVGGTRSQDLSTLQLLSVPAAISFYKPLSNRLGVGFGIFVPSAVNEWQRNSAGFDADGSQIDVTYENRLQGSDFRIGGGIGYALTDKLRVGAGLFIAYTTATLHIDFSGIRRAGATAQAMSSISINDELMQLGAVATLGAQWDLTPELTIGTAVWLPQLQFSTQDRLSEHLASVDTDGGTFDATNSFRLIKTGARATSNARVSLGAGYKIPKFRMGVEASFADLSGDLQKANVWNARIGAQFLAFEGVWVGGGLFTDRSPDRYDSNSLLSQSVDFYGVTAGIRLESYYLARLVHDWQGKSAEQESSLIFFTSVTGRYARGTGKMTTILIDSGSNIETSASDVTVNEVSGQLSTGVAF